MSVEGDLTGKSGRSIFDKPKEEEVVYVSDRVYKLFSDHIIEGRIINTGTILDGMKILKYRRQ